MSGSQPPYGLDPAGNPRPENPESPNAYSGAHAAGSGGDFVPAAEHQYPAPSWQVQPYETQEYPAPTAEPDSAPGAEQQYSAAPSEGQPYQTPQYPGQPYQNQGQPYPGQPYQNQGQPYQNQQYPGQPYPGQPGVNPQVPQQPGTNGLAIGALATGIIGIFPVAIGLGIAGLVQTNRTKQPGRGMAIAGIVLGVIWLVISVVFVVVPLLAVNDALKNDSPSTPGTSTGTSIEDLYDECSEGDMDACDSLWLGSASGSEEEAFAETCGGRFPADSHRGTCDASESTAEESSASLSALVSSCEAGDMEACDDLFWASDVGSDEERVAKSCGGADPSGTSSGVCADTVETSDFYGACEDGDMEACDSLWWDSDIGSSDEAFAETCGGRFPAGSHSGTCAD